MSFCELTISREDPSGVNIAMDVLFMSQGC